MPAAATLPACAGLGDVLTELNVEQSLWLALVAVMGDPGQDMRQVAALNRWAITQAISNVVLPENAPLSVIQAAQFGLVWRSCRKALFLKGGGKKGRLRGYRPLEHADSSSNAIFGSQFGICERKCVESVSSGGPDG